MSEKVGEIPQKPSFFNKIRERFVKVKERSAQVKLGSEMAKDAEAKRNLSDKLQHRIDAVVTTETKIRLGETVEQEWLKAYQRIYDALGEGKVKQVMDNLEPVLIAEAKISRVASSLIERGLHSFAINSALKGIKRTGIVQEINQGYGRVDRLPINISRAKGDFIGAGVAIAANVELLSIGSAKATGFVGEKVVKIVNKIMHKPDLPVEKMPAPAA